MAKEKGSVEVAWLFSTADILSILGTMAWLTTCGLVAYLRDALGRSFCRSTCEKRGGERKGGGGEREEVGRGSSKSRTYWCEKELEEGCGKSVEEGQASERSRRAEGEEKRRGFDVLSYRESLDRTALV